MIVARGEMGLTLNVAEFLSKQNVKYEVLTFTFKSMQQCCLYFL